VKRTLRRPVFLISVILALAAFSAIHSARPAEEAEARISPDSPPNDHCTVILVGKDASADGSVMATHAADCGICDWTWRKVPAAEHTPGQSRKLYHISQTKAWPPKEGSKWDLIKKDFTGVEIPEPARTYGYMHGVFGYLNDQSLAFGESTIGTVRGWRIQRPRPKPTSPC
jgi:dipeptidase